MVAIDNALSRAEFRYSLSGIKIMYWLLIGLGVFFLLLSGLAFADKQFNVVLLAIFAPLGLAAIAFAFWYKKRRENDRDPKLVIDAAAIHPVTATAKPIPWADVEKVVFIQTRPKKPGFMAIDVKGDIGRFDPTRGTSMMAKAYSMLGFGEITVQSLDLDGTHEQIKAAILAANPHVEIWDK